MESMDVSTFQYFEYELCYGMNFKKKQELLYMKLDNTTIYAKQKYKNKKSNQYTFLATYAKAGGYPLWITFARAIAG